MENAGNAKRSKTVLLGLVLLVLVGCFLTILLRKSERSSMGQETTRPQPPQAAAQAVQPSSETPPPPSSSQITSLDDPQITDARIEFMLKSGASQLTRSEAAEFLSALAIPVHLRTLVPTLLASADPWYQILGWMALVESGSRVDWGEFPISLRGNGAIDPANIHAISAFADWLWLSGRFDQWEGFLNQQLAELTANNATALLGVWRSNRPEVPALISLLGPGSVPLNSVLSSLVQRSEVITEELRAGLLSGDLSKHWIAEYWKLLSQSGFPGGTFTYAEIVDGMPESPQKRYAQTLLDEYGQAQKTWEGLRAGNFATPELAYSAAAWLYDHSYVEEVGSADLLQLEACLTGLPRDDRLNRLLSFLNREVSKREIKE